MIKPELKLVWLNGDEQIKALKELHTYWVLPDGSEAVDKRIYNIFSEQLGNGYYYKLVWPAGTTEAQILEFYDFSRQMIRLYKLGLI